MRRITRPQLLPIAALALATSGSVAAAPFGTLTFLEPEGIVGQEEDIPVWLRFVLNSELPPLTVNVFSSGPGGLSLPAPYAPASLSAVDESGNSIRLDPASTIFTLTSITASPGFLCVATFTASCTQGPPYDFSFNHDRLLSPFAGGDPYDLSPGIPVDFLFGTFRPTGGVAPLGEYSFFGAVISIGFRGTALATQPVLDEFGNPVPRFETDGTGELVLDGDGNPIPLFETDGTGELVLDGDGNPIPLIQRDEFGNPVLDTDGNTIPVFETDGTGELVLDGDGNPIPLIQRDEFGNPVLDADGNTIPVFGTTTIAYDDVQGGFFDLAAKTPCFDGPHDSSCTARFSRVVVPLPPALVLLASALGVSGLGLRRRPGVRATPASG